MSHLPKYIETLDLIEVEITHLKVKTDDAGMKAGCTLLAITLDHAQGIKFCLMNSAYPSAFALLRIIFETYIRGMWLARCANSAQVDKYINEDKVRSKNSGKMVFGDMVLEVESKMELPAYFSEIKEKVWHGLNSLTHSGSIQLHRNFDGKSIKHGYEDDLIDEAVIFSAMISCFAFAGLCGFATSTNGQHETEKVNSFVQSWMP